MRLLIASGTVAPEIGGPSTFIASAVPRLVERGIDVRVLAFAPSNAAESLDPAPVTRIARTALPGRLAAYARAYRRLARTADCVLALGLLLPRPTPHGVPVVIKVPGDTVWERAVARGWVAPTEEVEGFDARRHARRVEWLKRWRRAEVRRAAHVVVPSRFLRDMAASWGVRTCRLSVIPNAVPDDGHARAIDASAARRALGWGSDEPVVVVAGRLVRWKHVDLVFEAARAVPGLRIVVAGEGPEQRRLETLAQTLGVRAEFAGALPGDALTRVLRAADYLVLYSSYEGLSHTAIEALVAGTPVVASRRGGNPEVVDHGRNGLLVEHPDVGALAAALGEAFAPGRRAQLAAGTTASRHRFAPDGQVAALVDLLHDVTSPRSASGRGLASSP